MLTNSSIQNVSIVRYIRSSWWSGKGFSGGNYFGAGLRNDALDCNIRSGQRVHHLTLPQSGSVVLEGDQVMRFIMAETAQAVGVGEFGQVG